MDILKASEHAQALYDAHGDKAEFEAAQRQKESETAGDEKKQGTGCQLGPPFVGCEGQFKGNCRLSG